MHHEVTVPEFGLLVGLRFQTLPCKLSNGAVRRDLQIKPVKPTVDLIVEDCRLESLKIKSGIAHG